MKSSDLNEGDTVAFLDFMKDHAFGYMQVVNVLPNNRVDVKLNNPEKPSVWTEYTVDLKLIKRKNSPC